jgi:REP element-mobilizing transposase RayT
MDPTIDVETQCIASLHTGARKPKKCYFRFNKKLNQMSLFRNKYRIGSSRMPGWDYGSPGTYYVTICTKDREHFLGEIIDQKMHLSESGKQVELEWLQTPALRRDMNLTLGRHVVMPNHFHGIISIGLNAFNTPALRMPGTTPTDTRNQFGPHRKNLPSIIAGFKGAVTKYARINNIVFDWQSLYWDHIIRTERDLYRVEYYIDHNVENWRKDRFNR